ncbi:MAG: ABC transporter ATP-binding protein/permease [Verrucomicrobia bacterium]|nr:ABC transporter ATP-binding protein/permease [Verrucomicrobiota bacterium]
MADRSGKSADGSAAGAQPGAVGRLVPEMLMMFRITSTQRTKIVLLAVGLLLVIAATALGQIRLNAWNQPFYNALERRDLPGFFSQFVIFCLIAGALLVLNVAQVWLNQATKVKLREGLVRDLFDQWLRSRRAFRLTYAGEIGANPDQRIHEDARHLTELSTDLGIGLLQSSLLLGSFIGVLWMLSGNVVFHVSGRSFVIPGYMVWCALGYTGTASWISWLVGRPLAELYAARYAQEAELRFALVHLNEHIDSVSLYDGEEGEKQHLITELKDVLGTMWQIVGATTRLTWITAGYGWSTIIGPTLVAAPAYFRGNLSFGALMMAVGAFIQVQQSLRWFIDNFSTIADWRATLQRVAGFRETLISIDRAGATETHIEFVKVEGNKVTFENLEIATPTGSAMLSERHVEIAPGERVVIVGAPGTGKTLLFRAIAGLWPWGSGRVALPSIGGVMFVPRQPYVPLGALRAALAYPSPETAFKEEELVAVLQRAGLDRLSSSLSQVARWDKELTDEEQQCLVLGRVLLHKPRLVVIDEALDALDDDTRNRVLRLLDDELKEAGVINIGRPETKIRFFTRVLHLVKDPQGRCFLPDQRFAYSSTA